MDKKILVEDYIKEGALLIRELDKKKLPVSAALWFYFAEAHFWKLLIVSEAVKREGQISVYRSIQEIIGKKNVKNISLSDIAVVDPSNSLILLLQTAIRTAPKDVAKIRFTANTINNIYIEDAFIYRLSLKVVTRKKHKNRARKK